MRAILAAFLFIQACGALPELAEPRVEPAPPGTADPVGQTGPDVDPRLLEAMQVWKEDCQRYSALDCKGLADLLTAVKVGTLERGTLGVCHLKMGPFVVVQRDITITPDILDRPLYLRAVLAHEVGHCALLVAHVTSKDGHLMAPYMQPERVLATQLPTMLQQFYADVQAKVLPTIKD